VMTRSFLEDFGNTVLVVNVLDFLKISQGIKANHIQNCFYFNKTFLSDRLTTVPEYSIEILVTSF